MAREDGHKQWLPVSILSRGDCRVKPQKLCSGKSYYDKKSEMIFAESIFFEQLKQRKRLIEMCDTLQDRILNTRCLGKEQINRKKVTKRYVSPDEKNALHNFEYTVNPKVYVLLGDHKIRHECQPGNPETDSKSEILSQRLFRCHRRNSRKLKTKLCRSFKNNAPRTCQKISDANCIIEGSLCYTKLLKVKNEKLSNVESLVSRISALEKQ